MVKPFVVWVVSCLIFIVFVSSSNVIPYTKTEASIRNVFLLVLFFVGILSYFIFLHRYSKRYGDFRTVAMAIFLVIASFFSLLTISNSSFLKYKQTEKKPDNTKVANFNLINPGITVGVTGDDVKIIQSALKSDPSLYPSGVVSGYYGNLTKEAVINFQSKYLLTESGTMDNQTTEKFNEVYGNQTRSYYLNLYPTNIPAPIYVDKQVNTTNTDPITNCQNPNCGQIQIRKSLCSDVTGYVCCQIGNTWTWYSSRDKCKQDQNNYYNQRVRYTVPTYAPLPTLKPWPTYPPLPTYAPMPTIAPYVYVPPTKSPDQCKSEVVSYYAGFLQSCNQYGGTSAYDACIEIYSNERSGALAQCGN